MESGYGSQTTKVQRYGSHQEGIFILSVLLPLGSGCAGYVRRVTHGEIADGIG